MKVLVVEDDAVTRNVLCQILRPRPGWEVVAATSAEEAQRFYQGEFFELVILDLNLPEMNGLDFSRWLRGQPGGDRTYILVGTATAGGEKGTHTLNQVLESGADDYIAKPYQPALLGVRLAVAEIQIKHLAHQKDLEIALNQEKDFVSAVLNTAAVLIVVFDADFRVIRTNPAFQNVIGFGDDFTSALQTGLFAPDVLPLVIHHLKSLKTDPEPIVFETELKTVRGEDRYISWTASMTSADNPQEAKIILSGVDITERHGAQKQLAFLALHDPLTQCYNRNYLAEVLNELVQKPPAAGLHALLSIDLDNFKLVNDSVGHAAGDQLLITLVRFFRESIRPEDEVIRFGGDEFIIVLNNVHLEEAKRIAERIRERVDEFVFFYAGKRFAVGVSIGVALVDPRLKLTPDQIIARADSACYAAKAQGCNRVEVYENSAQHPQNTLAPIDWKDRIREALREDKFQLHFQPIVDLRTGKIFSYEALLRLLDADGKWALPHSFLPAAERLKIIPQIDRYVVRQAARLLAENAELNLSVNLSAQSLVSDEIAELIEQVFSPIPDGARRVCFEITETAVISDVETVRRLMEKLHQLGFRFSLDDFGVGFSSFDYLKKLPVDYLKIDGSFIVDLVSQPVNRAFVKGINQIAHELKIKTVAEYVETEAILQVLKELDVDFVQGFYIGKPAATFERVVIG